MAQRQEARGNVRPLRGRRRGAAMLPDEDVRVLWAMVVIEAVILVGLRRYFKPAHGG